MSKVDEDEVVKFIRDKGLKGPEGDMGKDGQYDTLMLESSAVLSNVGPTELNDEKLCANYL